uniref:Knottin scorpion toxin-like domain-containing protein n=1 Tax=Aegilops tauschii TaxID=37682 RepID=N1QPF9_AEGTA
MRIVIGEIAIFTPSYFSICKEEKTCTEHRANKGAACINEYCWKDCARDYHGHYVKNAYCTGVYPFTKVYCVCDVCDE